MHGHDQFFEGRIAGPLADAVDGAFELARPGSDCFEKVGYRQPQVVVAVDRNHRLVNVGHVGFNAANEVAKFARGKVAHGVGNVDGGGPGGDRRLQHLIQKLGL